MLDSQPGARGPQQTSKGPQDVLIAQLKLMKNESKSLRTIDSNALFEPFEYVYCTRIL